MEIARLHRWPGDPKSARRLQERLSNLIVLRVPPKKGFTFIAGADVSSQPRFSTDRRLWATVVVLKLPDMQVVEEAFAVGEAKFPYIPGLLSFRELPVVLKALSHLKTIPDLVICDGQGLAHPRSLGLACHLGLWLNLPTIGCAKSRLVGTATEPGIHRGDWEPLRYEDRTVGGVLRTRHGSKPVFVSPGHLMDVEQAVKWVLSCCHRARLPEPTRLAHLAVNRFRRDRSESCDLEHNS